MASRRSTGAISTRDGADAVGDAFQLVAQGLAQLQEALRLQKQEAAREVQETLRLQKQEAAREVQEALRLQKQEAAREVQEALRLQKQEAAREVQEALRLQKQETAREVQEALRLQEERAAAVMREMERKIQEKDAAIHSLEQRLRETQDRFTAMEERTNAPEGSGEAGAMQRREGRVNEVEASLQSVLPPSSTPTPTPSGAGHQGAAVDEEERARQRVELRVREAKIKMEEARTSPSALGEQLCKAAREGRLLNVVRLLDSGADVNYINEFDNTPLRNATWGAHAGVVSFLLQRGADANALNIRGTSALHWAASDDQSRRCVVLLLRAGADVDARNVDGVTPLHNAAYSNKEEAVRELLAAGARTDLKPWGGPRKNKTPFDVALYSNIQDLLRL